ncbi:MAG: hypothetical protein M3P10_06335 [Actinomycetota bacterium]|nr:hypothetical protein [Actinomycetota bacterium]
MTGLLLPIVLILAWGRLRALDAAARGPGEGFGLHRQVPFLTSLPLPTLEHLARQRR